MSPVLMRGETGGPANEAYFPIFKPYSFFETTVYKLQSDNIDFV